MAVKRFALGALVTYRSEPWIVIEWLPDIENYLIESEANSEWRKYVYKSEVTPRKKSNKYNAIKVVDPEHGRFDSQAEYARWCELLLLQEAGEISNLKRQVSLELIRPIEGDDPRIKLVRYKVDFTYYEMDSAVGIKKFVAEEVKGMWTPEARLKAYLFMLKYPHIKYVVTGTQL